jgi:hypothetical protein
LRTTTVKEQKHLLARVRSRLPDGKVPRAR